jgi:L-cysteate sulfo-lyase
MDGLRSALGGRERCPRLWVKHEDLIPLGGGGNKIRKLEFVIAEAVELGCNTIISTGGIQSNQTRQIAAAAARLGLECHLLLRRSATPVSEIYEHTGNILVCRLFGAHIHFVEEYEDRNAVMQSLAATLRVRGKQPYVIPVGASTREGIVGSMLCGEEILLQAAENGFTPDWMIVAVGSSGTCAGIFAGAHVMLAETMPMGFLPDMRILGVDVLGPETDQGPAMDRLVAHAKEAVSMLGHTLEDAAFRHNDQLRPLPKAWEGSHLELTGAFVGPGYARPYPDMIEALRLAARNEGLILDPIYTGKAMAAMVAGVRDGLFTPRQNVVFLHSGGQSSLYAYAHQLEDVL